MLLSWDVHGNEPVEEELGLVAEQSLVLNGSQLLWSKGAEERFMIQAQYKLGHAEQEEATLVCPPCST